MLQECNEDYESCIIGTYLWAPYLSPSNGRKYDGNSSQDTVKQNMEPQESVNHFASIIQDLLLHVYCSGLLNNYCCVLYTKLLCIDLQDEYYSSLIPKPSMRPGTVSGNETSLQAAVTLATEVGLVYITTIQQ